MSLKYHYLLFLLHFIPSIRSSLQQYTPTDLILLNCGASSTATSLDGRNWDADAHSKFLASDFQTASFPLSPSQQDPSAFQVPYKDARVSQSNFTYLFPVSPGSKFVRLYFYPTNYPNLEISKSFFSLTANDYTLLRNFSAVSSIKPGSVYFVKEYVITVWDNQKLKLTFSASPGSFAFINGIEIVSMPNNLYTNMSKQYPLIDSGTMFYLDNSTSLETMYRINVGGGYVPNFNDTGMFRTWHDDVDYIFGAAFGVVESHYHVKLNYTDTPAYVAPASVYNSARSMGPTPEINLNYNLTWLFPVDSGFLYLVRLHFCEVAQNVTRINERVFNIYINNMTAETQADIINWSGGGNIPSYKDYVIFFPQGSLSKQDLWLAIHPSSQTRPMYYDALLNGVEMFKLSRSDGSLAGLNSDLVGHTQPNLKPNLQEIRKKSKTQPLVIGIVVSVPGSLLAFFLIFIVYFYQRNHKVKRTSPDHDPRFLHKSAIATSIPTSLCHQFRIAEIKEAARNFDEGNVIGSGGFGKVYRGNVEGRSIQVAIKRLDSASNQGTNEFKTEINMLSQLRHVNLVSLIGYCIDEGEMILVYDYMINGTLREHLYDTYNDPLPWKKRLEICIGAARGLDYLHTGLNHTIIHRDVKTTNILLDQKCVAKVSDFGLSKIGLNTNAVSTVVKGTWGYLDPEYARFQQLTDKSDVYSFGVVLFEVLCARKPVDQNLEYEQKSLVNWARKCIQNGTIYQIIDPYLKAKIAPECFKKFVKIAESCVRNQGIERPKMNDVMGELEFALQLQEAADAEKQEMNPGVECSYPEVSFLDLGCANVGGDKLGSLNAEDTSGFTSFVTNSTVLMKEEVATEILIE